MFIDGLCFDGEYPGVSGDAGAEVTAHIAEGYNKLARQRQARDAVMDDLRTTRIAEMLAIANKLTALNHDVTRLVLHDSDNGALKLLQLRLRHAEEYASLIYQDRLKEACNG